MLTEKQERFIRTKAMTLAGCIGDTAWRLADEVLELKFSPDGKTLWIDARLSQVAVDVATGRRVDLVPRATGLKASADQQWQFEVRKVWKGKKVYELPAAWARAVSNAGRVVTYASNVMTLFDLPSTQPLKFLPAMRGDVKAAEISADGAFVLAGDAKHDVTLFDVDAGRAMETWKKARVLGFSPGRAFIGRGSDVLVHALPSGKLERTLQCPGEAHRLSPDGTRVGFARDQQVHVVSVETGEQALTLDVNTEQFAFSPDGTRMAVVDLYPDTPHEDESSGVVFLVDTATGETVSPRDEGHRGAVTGVAVPAGQPGLLVSIGDQSLRVWDRTTHHLVERVDELVGPDGLAVTADGRWAAVASRDDAGSMLVDLTSLESAPFACDAADVAVMDPAGSAVALLGDETLRVFSVPGRKLLSEGRRPEVVFAHDGLCAIAETSLWKWTGDGFAHHAPAVEVADVALAGISGNELFHTSADWNATHVLATHLETGRTQPRIKQGLSDVSAVGATHFVNVTGGRFAAGDANCELKVYRLSDGKEVASARWPAADRAVSLAITDRGEVFAGTLLGRVLCFQL